MDITYVYYGATETAIPTTSQITMYSLNVHNVIADGPGAFMRLNADAILMTITYTTFNTMTSGTMGGVFFIDNLGGLTFNYNTLTFLYAPSGGRFMHQQSSTDFKMTMYSNNLYCHTGTYTASTV